MFPSTPIKSGRESAQTPQKSLEIRAATALPTGGKKDTSTSGHENNSVLQKRPFTHEGRGPIPPSTPKKKSFRTVSTRHITIGFEESDSINLLSNNNTAEPSLTSQPTKPDPNIINVVLENRQVDTEEVIEFKENDKQHDFAIPIPVQQALPWADRFQSDFLKPTFIKPTTKSSTARPTTAGASFVADNDTNNLNATRYPSLGHRLKASISTNPNKVVPKNLPPHGTISLPMTSTSPVKTRPMTATVVTGGVFTQPHDIQDNFSMSQVTSPFGNHPQSTYKSAYHNDLTSSHIHEIPLMQGEFRSLSPPMPVQTINTNALPTHTMPTAHNLNNESVSGQSALDFDSMDIEDMLHYLLALGNSEGTGHSNFLHVTSRHHIDPRIVLPNFYDLVILERPGYPTSGYVWTREIEKHLQLVQKTLPKHHIMQLSIFGLLVAEENADVGELVPIQELFIEKKLFEHLRSRNRYFKYFFHFKYFRMWKQYVKHVYFSRMKKNLIFNSFFSNPELVESLLYVKKMIHYIDQEIDFFHFLPPGYCNIMKFMELQIGSFDSLESKLKNHLNSIKDFVWEQYQAYISSPKLLQQLDEIRKHHPSSRKNELNAYATGFTATNRSNSPSRGTQTTFHPQNILIESILATERGFESPEKGTNTRPSTATTRPRTAATTTTFATTTNTAGGMNDTENNVDWVQIRSIQRIYENYQAKLARLFIMTQYCMESTVASLLQKFWFRMKQVLLGIPKLTSKSRTEISHVWEIEKGLFDEETGKLVPAVYDQYYENMVSSMRLQEEQDLLDEQQSASSKVNNKRKQSSLTASKSTVEKEKTVIHDETTSIDNDHHNTKEKEIESKISEGSHDNPAVEEDEEEKFFRSMMKLKESQPIKSVNWINGGCHLGVEVYFYYQDHLLEISDLLHLTNVDNIKIKVIPNKPDLTLKLHQICNRLGNILSHLPNFKGYSQQLAHEFSQQHNRPAVNVDEGTQAVLPATEDTGLLIADTQGYLSPLFGNSNTKEASHDKVSETKKETHSSKPDTSFEHSQEYISHNYFTLLTLFPTYNSKNAYNLALDTIYTVQTAFSQAVSLDNYIIKLSEIVRKLWSLTPNILVKQLERSFIVPKIRDYIIPPLRSNNATDSQSKSSTGGLTAHHSVTFSLPKAENAIEFKAQNTIMIDDLLRSQVRDQNRMVLFQHAMEYLEKLTHVLQPILNLKHSNGLITSFSYLLQQLYTYKCIQYYNMNTKLSHVYNLRCSSYYEFIRLLESIYDHTIVCAEDEINHDPSKSLQPAGHRSHASAGGSDPLGSTTYNREKLIYKRIELLQKIKSFEEVRVYYEKEAEINDYMYEVIEKYSHRFDGYIPPSRKSYFTSSQSNNEINQMFSMNLSNDNERMSHELKVEKVLEGISASQKQTFSRSLASKNQLSPEKLYRAFHDGLDRLSLLIANSKAYLLSSLMSMKYDLFHEKEIILSNIQTCQQIVERITILPISLKRKNKARKANDNGSKLIPSRVDEVGEEDDEDHEDEEEYESSEVSNRKSIRALNNFSAETKTNASSRTPFANNSPPPIDVSSSPATMTKKSLATTLLVSPQAIQSLEQHILNLGKTVSSLRFYANEHIASQYLLVIAHEIVGAASAAYSSQEVDQFSSMSTLELLYEIRYTSWYLLQQSSYLMTQLLLVKFPATNTVSNFATIITTQQKALTHDLNSRTLLQELCTLFLSLVKLMHNLQQKIERCHGMLIAQKTPKSFGASGTSVSSIDTGSTSNKNSPSVPEELEYLLSYHEQMIEFLYKQLLSLQPQIELISCLFNQKALKARHWMTLNTNILPSTGLELKFSGRQNEFISVVLKKPSMSTSTTSSLMAIMNNAEQDGDVVLGNLYRLQASQFLDRGLEDHISTIKEITSGAVIESILETTLDCVDWTLRHSTIQLSAQWMKPTILRNKLLLDLSEAVNFTSLEILSQYVWKAIIMIENTAQDMSVRLFTDRIEKYKEAIIRFNKFLSNYQQIQSMWYYLFIVLKFTPRNELEREMIRMYYLCTEEMKKMELILHQKNGNIYSLFMSNEVSFSGLAGPSNEFGDGKITKTSSVDATVPPAVDTPPPPVSSPTVGHTEETKEKPVVGEMVNLDSLKSNLSILSEDMHSIIQSLLDGCPRLSLLSYHQLAEMLKIWLVGPQLFVNYFSQCMQQLFEGVGELQFVLHSAQIPLATMSSNGKTDEKSAYLESSDSSMHSYVCIGFLSRNFYETVHFSEAIPSSPNITLDEFTALFELQLRKTMCKQCDTMILHRIHCIQGLFADNSLQQILTSLESLFSIRINSLQSKLSNDILNAVYLLMNQVSFSEDVWTCLGHPTGCFTIVRRDLMIETTAFQNAYLQSLRKHAQIIQETIVILQDWLRKSPTSISRSNGGNFNSGTSFSSQGTISYAKQKSLFTALLLQEISFLRILDELMTCSCLESCLELWAGHYQLKFQYDQESRYNYCPIDITMGNISIPYGMEYTGNSTVCCMTKEMEYALNRALSSAFSSRGTTIINTATSVNAQGINTTSIGSTSSNSGLPTVNGNSNFGDSNSNAKSTASSTFYTIAESSVTGKDIANALGRICTTLSSCSNPVHVRFFFARIVYLDAIGCIDFTTLNEYHLQILVQVAQTFWSILENKNDQYIQDSLKFPIKTKFLKNDIYSDRKKRNLIQLRNLINWKKTQKFYISFILIGFASEVQFVNMKVFDQFYRSIFDSVSLPMRAPLSDLGVLLSSHGFYYGMTIQSALLQSIHSLVSNTQFVIPFNSGVYGLPGSSLAGNNSNMVNIQYTLQLEDMRKLFPMKDIASFLKACQQSLEIFPFTKYYQEYLSTYPSITATSNVTEAAQLGAGSSAYTTREKIGRFKLEVTCFLANCWCYLIHQCYMNTEMLDCIESIITIFGNNNDSGRGGNYDTAHERHELIQYLVLLYTKLFESMIHQLSQFMHLPTELDDFYKELLQSYQINHVFTLDKTIQNCLVLATQQWGYISNSYFLQSCGLFWEQLNSRSSSVCVLSGEVYIGKTAILNTVLSGMDILAAEMHQRQLEYSEMHEQYQKELNQQGGSNGTFITPWNRNDYQSYGNKISNKLNSFLSLTTTFQSIQLWKVSSLPIQCVIAARKITKTLQLWNAYCKYQKQNQDLFNTSHNFPKFNNPENSQSSRTVTFSQSMRETMILSTPSKSDKKNTSILKSPSTSSKSRKTILPKDTQQTDDVSQRQDAKLKPITTHQTTIIYHASLTLQYLIGSYESGKWMDGLLLRKLRMLQERKSNSLENSLVENKITSFWNQQTKITPLQLIVLTGPITYHIESLLHSMYFESTLMGLNHSFPHKNNFLTFPTGEYVSLPPHVKLIIETSDLRNASPSCLSLLPIQTISYPIEETYQRILSVWVRSIFHWLGDFLPWLEFLDELNFIFFRTKFINDLLHSDLQYHSQTKSSIAVGLIQSRISGFLRLLEELLLQIHELALVNATFSTPDADESFYESDSSDEEQSDKTKKKVKIEEEFSPPSHSTSPRGDGTGKFNFLQDKVYPGSSTQQTKKYKGLMTLSIQQRELLIHRARLALVYAATWGIGGHLNSTERRRFFDSILRDLTQQVFDSSHKNYQATLNGMNEPISQPNKIIELNIASDCMLFDCILDIPECCIKPALQYNMKALNSRLNDLQLPEKFQDIHVFGELIHHPSQASNRDYLVFRSIGTRAVTAAFKLLLSSGSNICLFGQKGSGKTRLISEVLADFKQNCPTPDDIREQIMNNLINIVNGTDIPQGIFQAIEKLKAVLHDASKLTTNREIENNYYSLWYELGRHLQVMWSDSARKHCRNKTVSSSMVSLRSLQGAHDLRYWMKREFSTETPEVLETSRFTYGVAFIDDMHCLEDFDALLAAQKSENLDFDEASEIDDQIEQEKRAFAAAFGSSRQNTRLDRHEALLKGLLHGYPPFALQRNLVVRNPIKLGFSQGYYDTSFPRQMDTIPPILHRELASDMRITASYSSSANSEVHDDFVMNRLGIVSAVTGHSVDFRTNTAQNASALATLLNQFACLSLPSFTYHELHVAMIVGAYVSMTSGSTLENLNIMNMLQAEIIELSRITMVTSSKIISTTDVTLTTLLERTVRSSILLEISLVNRFCMSLRYGCNHVKNPGGLLQLYAHEWKRFFVDPLPNGAQRDRVINLFHEQLEILDETNWKITRDWIQLIKDDLSSFVDRVWVNTTIFKKSKLRNSNQFSGGKGLARETFLAKPTDLLDAAVIPNSQSEQESNVTNKQELYVPVEFDIVGMERFLSSGAFNRFTNVYDPVLTPQQITGGSRIQRTIHLEEHLTSDEIHSLLFPAALSLLLRIVRILSVTGKHVLLAGYSGSSRNRAILLAAKLCDLEPRLFSIKEYNDVVESNPSEKAILAMNFRHFMKTLVLRSCGLSDPITAEDEAAHNMNMFIAAGQVVFQNLAIIPSLVIVDGAQQLTTEDRYMLLQVLDYDDPSILFSDAEIHGIGDALRKRQEHGSFVISLKESFLQSGTSHATEFNPLVTVTDPSENEVTFAKLSSSLHSKMVTDDASINTKDDSYTKDLFEESGEVDDWQATGGKLESGYNSYLLNKGNLTGYTFHWVRRCLRKGIRQNLRFCLQVELSRSMEIDPKLFLSGSEAFQLLKKRNSAAMQNVPDRKINKTNSSQYNSLKSTLSNTTSTTSLFINPKQKRHSSVGSIPRYSLLSNRSSNATTRDSKRDSRRGSSKYDPNIQAVHQLDDPSTPINANDMNGKKTSANQKGNVSLGSHSLFTCSILGPILSRQFTLIWYDIDYVDAVQGICNLLMKNEKPLSAHQGNTPTFSNTPLNKRSSMRKSIISTMRTNDSIISLKSSEVGKYHVSQIAAPSESGNTTQPSSSEPQPKRRMTTVELKAQEFEDSRQKQFLSLQQEKQKLKDLKRNHDLFDYFHIAIKTIPDDHQQILFSTFSMFQNLYLFQHSSWSIHTVQTYLPPNLLVEHEAKINLQLAHYIEEARILLPHLLSIPLPCDAMFFTSPIYILGAEHIAIRCSESIMHILETHGKSLLLTKVILEEVVTNYTEALYALEHIDDVDEIISSQNEELSVASKQLASEITRYKEEINQVDIKFNKTVDYEHELMMQEDILSTQRRLDEYESLLDDALKDLRHKFSQFTNTEWKNMTNYYTNKPIFKPMIDVMRAIMIIINYTPKLTKAEKAAAAAAGNINNTSLTVRLDDEMIARSGVSLLIKHQELINQLCQIIPYSISTVQYNALKVMNTLLNYQFADDWKDETLAPTERYLFYVEHLEECPYPVVEQTPSIALVAAANAAAAAAAAATGNSQVAPLITAPVLPPPAAEPVVHPIFDIFRRYLLVLELFAASTEMIHQTKEKIQEMKLSYLSLVHEHAEQKQQRRQAFVDKSERLAKKIDVIEVTMNQNREKLATIQRNRKFKAELIKSLKEVEIVAKEKLTSIIEILQVFLADLCISVVLLHRVGFLPDHMRQDCLETLRINLLSYNVKMSDTPFVLGCLLDRLQVRSWVQYNETTIANDIPCINSMSLLYFSPFYTLVVDPNGDSYNAISESMVSADDYEVYTTSGQKFSLTVFDSWIETWCSTCTGANNNMLGTNAVNKSKEAESNDSNNESDEKGFCLIVTDIQAGVSEDLICFLSAKLHSHLQHIHYDNDITAVCEVDFTSKSGASSPNHDKNFESTGAGRKQLHTVDLYCGSLPYDPHSRYQKTLGFISIPKKFRLILITSRPPVLDPTGTSFPLPVACMDYVTVVFWSINMGDKFIVESSPIQNVMENNIMSGGNHGSGNSTTDYRFNYQVTMKFLSTLSPHMMEQLFETNEIIHKTSLSLQQLELDIILKVFVSNHLLNQTKHLHAHKEVEKVTRKLRSISFDDELKHDTSDEVISLNIVEDDKLMKMILKSTEQRSEHQSFIVRKRLLFREYFTYFSCISEVFTMSSYFLKLCGNFLPSECFSPYALTSQAVIINLLPNVIKYLKKLQLVKCIPVNLYHAYRIVHTIVILQRRLRKFIAQQRAAQEELESERRISGSGGDVRQFRISKPGLLIGDENRKSMHSNSLPPDGNILPSMMMASDPPPSFSGGVGSDVKLTTGNSLTGLIPTFRYQGSKLLDFQLLPLRTLFLREMVRYIQLTIRPGFENITKFLLLLMTWSQSEKLPIDEIRAYLSIVLQHQQIDSFRFCYFQYIRKPSDGNESGPNTSLTHYYSPMAPSGMPEISNSFARPRSRASSGSNNDLGVSPPLSESPKQNSRERTYSSEEFMESLPGMANMTHRVTAFRSNNSTSNLAKNRQQVAGNNGQSMYILSDLLNPSNRLWLEKEIIEYGPGIPDGIWFSKSSTKWMITNTGHSVVNVSTIANEKQTFSTGKNLFSDEQLVIAPKNALIRIPIRYYQDSFEIEWLKIRGIRAFSTLNSPALIALGASNQVMEEINRSRQTMIKMPNGYSLKKPLQDRKKSVRASQLSQSPSQLISSSSTSFAPRKTSVKTGHGNQRPQKSNEGTIENVSLVRRKSSFHASMIPGTKPAGNTLSRDPSNDKLQYHHKLKIQQERRITTRATALLEDMASDIVKSRKLSVSQNNHRLSLMHNRRNSVQRVHNNHAPSNNTTSNNNLPRSRAGSAIQQLRNMRQTTIVNNNNANNNSGGAANSQQRQTKVSSTFSQAPLSLSGGGFSGNTIHDLVAEESIYTDLYLLENHPHLKNIYHGITAGIVRNLPDFEEWKESLIELETIDCHHLSPEELLEYVEIIQPPKCMDADDANNNATLEEGLWSQGYDLTILQSLLLCETLWPFSSDALLNFVYMLIVQYLKKDGFIVLHPDEIFVEDDEFDEDQEDDDDENVDDDMEESSSGKFKQISPSAISSSRLPRPSGGKKALSKLIERDDDEEDDEENEVKKPSKSSNKNEDDDEEEEEEDDYFPSLPTPTSATSSVATLTTARSGSNKTTPRSSFFQALHVYDQSLQPDSALQQDNVHIVNSWFKLSHLLRLANEGKPVPSPQLAAPQSSQCAVSNRDFYNYEVVLMEVLSEYFEIDKFVFMKELRDTMLNNKSTYFLTSKNFGCQTSIFSQRAREYALLAEKHIPILYFQANFPTDDMTNGTNAKTVTGVGVAGMSTSTSAASTVNSLMVNPVLDPKKAYRQLLHEFLRLIKASLASNVQSRKAIIEMLQLSSFVGNAVINSVLLQSAMQLSGPSGSNDHMLMGAVSKVQAYQKALAKQQQMKVQQSLKVGVNSAIAKHLQITANTESSRRQTQVEEAEYRHWRHSFPLIISSEWNNVNLDYVSPPITLGELSYAWLPRYFAPDIVNLSTTSLHSIANSMNGSSKDSSLSNTQYTTNRILRTVPENVSIPETCGILYEEMESALLWIMNSSHSIIQTRVTQEIRMQLRLLSKTEIRIAASMITFWQIIQYQRNKSYEIAGFSSIWSSCLNSLNLWQLSRLLLKIHEFYEVHPILKSYQNASLLQVHPVFQQAVLVLMNSFSRLDCDFYHIGHFIYENKQFVEYYQKQQTRAANSSAYNSPAKDGGAGFRGIGTNTNTVPHPPSAFGVAPPSAPSNMTGSSISSNRPTSATGIGAAVVGGAKRQTAANAFATTAMSSRAMKQYLKQQKKLLDQREKFIHSLDSVDRYRLHIDLTTIVTASSSTATNQTPHRTVKDNILSGNAPPMISLTALEQRLIDEAFMKRMYAFLSTFLANIVVKKNQLELQEKRSEEVEDDEEDGDENEESGGSGKRRKTIQQVVRDIHRKSQKMNIQSVLSARAASNAGAMTGGHGGSGGNGNPTTMVANTNNKWIAKSHQLDVQFGNITADDLIKCMMKWSFDTGPDGGNNGGGGEENGSGKSGKRLTKSRKSKILVALKRLSTRVKKDREDEEHRKKHDL